MIARLLTPADLDALLALDAASNPHPWTAAQWQDSLRDHLCLGLFAEQTLCGFAIALPLPDEAELLLIAIEPALQGQGLGQQLLAVLQSALAAQNLHSLVLEVRASNLVAQRFYHAAGFIQAGQRKNYYPCVNGREDALIYRHDFAEALS